MVGIAAGGDSGWVQWRGADIPPPDFLEKTGSDIWESVDWWRIVATVLMLYEIFLDFTVSEKENDVSNEVEKQVPGVPDGYRLIAVRQVEKGDMFVGQYGLVDTWAGQQSVARMAIVEPVEPPKPKTEDVVLNKYLLQQGGQWRLAVCTAAYADAYFSDYKLIGPSETVTIEVE